VVGCGAIGGLFAARLATQPDVEVWAYDVSEEHVAAINRDGLRADGEVAGVQARTHPGEIPRCDFGLVATKATFTETAIAATAHLFSDGAVCSLQNGIGSEEAIARHVPRVIRGVTLLSGHVAAPGTIRMDAPGTTWMGPFEPQPASIEEIDALARATGAVALDDARGAQWTKLLFNAATNPLAALTGLTHGELCDRPDLRAVVSGLVAEGRSVADALGIALETDPEAMIDRAARENHDHQPSMLQDALAHRPTEIDALNGGITRTGAHVGVPTPLHAAIAALIRGMEAAW
jgi:2-dehydropantoate 2-reductase